MFVLFKNMLVKNISFFSFYYFLLFSFLFSFSLFFLCRLLRAELHNLRHKGAIKQFRGPTGVRSYTTSTCFSVTNGISATSSISGVVDGIGGGSLDRPCIDTNRTCARCRTELGRIINRGAPCRSCRLRVCKACREFSTRTTDWVCIVCHKQMWVVVWCLLKFQCFTRV